MKLNYYSVRFTGLILLLSQLSWSAAYGQATTITPPAEAAVGTWQVVRGSQRLQGAQYMKGSYANQPVAKWQAQLSTVNGGCEGDPVIGDINGDGKNDVVVTVGGNGTLFAFDGATGAQIWNTTGVSGQTSLALGDANGDGKTDIATVKDKLYLLDGNNGNIIWSFPVIMNVATRIESCPNMADLDHDGKVEVIMVVQDAIYAIDGLTGTQKWVYATGLPLKTYNGTAPAIADINGDGILDVVAPLQKSTNPPTNTQGGVLVGVDGATGTLLWSVLINSTGASGISAHFPAIGDVDGDCKLDVVFNTSAVRGFDGSIIWGNPATNGSRFQVVADLNNDCNVQVITSCSVLNAKTGAVIWQKPSCSQYGWFAPAPRVGEFNANSPGKEIIVAAAYQISGGVPVANPIPIQMYAGYTGTLLWSYDIATQLNHTVEGMAIGDIDNDGCVEIVVAPDCCNGAPTLLALDDNGNSSNCGILASIGQIDFVADSVSCTCRDFKDFSSACANSWDWSLPGGSPSVFTGKDPGTVCYSTPGTYTVMMTAKLNACAATDTVIHSVVINSCNSLPHAVFTSSDSAFCEEGGKCIDFTDFSTGSPTSWQWFFPGAQPDTSTDQNPANICYYVPGSYSVKLIVSNTGGTDTLNAPGLIVFGSGAILPTITQKGDTLFSSHAAAYQWYFNGSPIPGATDSFYVATQNGTYNVYITDDIGCSRLGNGIAVTLNVNVDLIDGLSQFEIFPNPAGTELFVKSSLPLENVDITLCNVLGEQVYGSMTSFMTKESTLRISTAKIAAGVYFLKFSTKDIRLTEKVFIQD